MTLSFIRPFVASNDVKWISADFSRTWYRSYADPSIQGEFYRFAYRDWAPTLTGLAFCIGFVAYVLLFTPQFPTEVVLPIVLVATVIGLLAVFVDIFFCVSDEWTRMHATLRHWTCLVYGVAVAVACDSPVGSLFSSCTQGRNLFSAWVPGMHPDDANAFQDCIRIIAPYSVVALLIAAVMIRTQPLGTIATALAVQVAFYSNYGTAGASRNLWAAGETTTELLLKALVYAVTTVVAVAVSYLRHTKAQAQFEAAVIAHTQSLLTKKRSEDVDAMLCAMVPESALNRLLLGGVVSDTTLDATVLFSDMVNFTAWSSMRKTTVIVAMLNTLCIEMDRAARAMGVEKIKTIGDAYWAVAGLPHDVPDHADVIVRFGLRMHEIAARCSARRAADWGTVRLRVGVNSGPLKGGIFGTSRLSYEVFGVTSDVAEQCEKNGVPDRVCITEATRRLLCFEFQTELYKILQADDMGLPPSAPPVHTHLVRDSSPSVSRPGSESSNRSSAVTPSTMVTGTSDHDAKHQQRRDFIEQRAARAARAAELDLQLEDSGAVEARLSTRRWGWVLLTFESAELEDQYLTFAHKQNQTIRRATRVVAIALTVLQIVVALADRSDQVPSATWVLLSLALIAEVGLAAIAFVAALEGLVPPAAEEVIMFAVFLIDIVGCGLTPDSLIGNDTTYAAVYFISITAWSTSALPAVAVLALQVCFGVVPTLWFAFSSLTVTIVFTFLFFTVLLATTQVVVSEKLLRRQFVEQQVQAHEHRLQLSREAEQRALLEAIVPKHVIAPLQAWLEADLNVNQTIAQVFERVAVGFLQLNVPSDDTVHKDEAWLFEAHVKIDLAITVAAYFDKIKTMGDKVMIAGSFVAADHLQRACAAMLQVMSDLQPLDILGGFHVGEVIGAVLGTQRLCFDIFGDAVNIASRVLTTLEPGERCGVSEVFYQALNGDNSDYAFSELKARAAKGKGIIEVRVVDFD